MILAKTARSKPTKSFSYRVYCSVKARFQSLPDRQPRVGSRVRLRRAGDDKEGVCIDADMLVRVNYTLGSAHIHTEIGTIEELQNPWLWQATSMTPNFEYSRWNTFPGRIHMGRMGRDPVACSGLGGAVGDHLFTTSSGTRPSRTGFTTSRVSRCPRMMQRRAPMFTHNIGDDALMGRVHKDLENSGKLRRNEPGTRRIPGRGSPVRGLPAPAEANPDHIEHRSGT